MFHSLKVLQLWRKQMFANSLTISAPYMHSLFDIHK